MTTVNEHIRVIVTEDSRTCDVLEAMLEATHEDVQVVEAAVHAVKVQEAAALERVSACCNQWVATSVALSTAKAVGRSSF